MDKQSKKKRSISMDSIIQMAWADRCSFEQIRERTGLSESSVIKVMRRELKPGSFRRWRARVSGRVTKHRKRFKQGRIEICQKGSVADPNLSKKPIRPGLPVTSVK